MADVDRARHSGPSDKSIGGAGTAMRHRRPRPVSSDRSDINNEMSSDPSLSSQPPRVHFPDDNHLPSRDAAASMPDGHPLILALLPVYVWLMDVLTALVAIWCTLGYATLLVVMYMTIRPFSIHAYRRYTATWATAPYVDSLTLLLPPIRLLVAADSDLPVAVGNSLLVSNHLVDADWWIFYLLGRCTGLHGCLRVFLRNEFLRIGINDSYNIINNNSSIIQTSGNLSQPLNATMSGSPDGGNGIQTALHLNSADSFTQLGGSPVNHFHGVGHLPSSTATVSNERVTPSATTTSNGVHGVGVNANGCGSGKVRQSSHDIALAAKVIHQFLDFPLMNGENNTNDRDQLFRLLRSFAGEQSTACRSDYASTGGGNNPTRKSRPSTNANGNRSSSAPIPIRHQQPHSSLSNLPHPERGPVQFLFFPEGWCLHDSGCHGSNSSTTSNSNNTCAESTHRQAVLAKSNEFANRTGRPVLRHLLLPRGRGFYASVDCLRDSNPIIYDVTLAFTGYDGSLPPHVKLSLPGLWRILRRDFPRDIHIRLKKYNIEDVLQDSNWLDKKWTEKDRMLNYFAMHQCFPDVRGYGGQCRIFDTRSYNIESSMISIIRMIVIPFLVPFLLLLSIPIFWSVLGMWIAFQAYQVLSDITSHSARNGGEHHYRNREDDDEQSTAQTPGSAPSADGGTPFPITPFVSPSVSHWRSALGSHQES